MRPNGCRDQTTTRTCRLDYPSRPSLRRSSRPRFAHAQSPNFPSSPWPGLSGPPIAARAVIVNPAAFHWNRTSRLPCVQSIASKQVFQHGERTRATKRRGASKTLAKREVHSDRRSPQQPPAEADRRSANIDRSKSESGTSRRTAPWPFVALVLPLCCEAVHSLSMARTMSPIPA
jgi:hypothetical protein